MGGEPLFTGAEIAAKIARDEFLFIAGDAALLRRLPRGRWIGGTSPEFGAESGSAWAFGLPEGALGAEFKRYDEASLPGIYDSAPGNGYSLIVLPAASRVLRSFALGAPRYESFACRPLAGWVSGVPLSELGATAPLVFDGRDGTASDDAALVMHVTLPKTMSAKLDYVNIFEPGEGPVLEFPEDGFGAREVLVDGRPRPLVAYVKESGLDLRLPLVADYNGAMVNTSFQKVDEAAGEVRFYGPVFRGVRYRQARPVGDYRAAFSAQLPEALGPRTAYACNCILNYLHAGLDVGRGAGPMGPATFGEVAYQLLNQTLVYLKVGDANLAERLCGTCALRRRYYALEALADDLEAFNAMAAHDLRAPLRHISAYATLLRHSPASDERARGLTERITDGVARMQTLLDALLAFSRAGRSPLLDEPVDLGELVASVRRDLEADPDAGRAEWIVAPLPAVRGDRGLLRQVVVNLLSNALKYSRGRPQPRVEVGVLREDGRPVVYVRDNGVGFAAQDAKRLFKPFCRLHPAAEYPGTGLGLASAARIVARHGGWVRAEGEPDRGACFYFSLSGA